jgi:hypothetical protein
MDIGAGHALCRQPVQIGCTDLRIRIETGYITISHVICQDVDNIRALGGIRYGHIDSSEKQIVDDA